MNNTMKNTKSAALRNRTALASNHLLASVPIAPAAVPVYPHGLSRSKTVFKHLFNSTHNLWSDNRDSNPAALLML